MAAFHFWYLFCNNWNVHVPYNNQTQHLFFQRRILFLRENLLGIYFIFKSKNNVIQLIQTLINNLNSFKDVLTQSQ
jgi:hypothetical protein